MVPSAPCCFSFFTYKHRSQRLGEDELCFVIFTYTLAQKSGQGGELAGCVGGEPWKRFFLFGAVLATFGSVADVGTGAVGRGGAARGARHSPADSDSYCGEEFFVTEPILN